jgi:hypothetical protein
MSTFYYRYVREQRKYFSVEAENKEAAELKANVLVGQLDFTSKDDESDDSGELSLIESEEG